MNELTELFNNETNYLLSSWESEILSVNLPSFCFTCLSNSSYQLKCDFYTTLNKYVGSESKNFNAGELGSLYVSNRTKYIKFSVNNLSTPCTLDTQGFCYTDYSININKQTTNVQNGYKVSNLPTNIFGEFKCGVPHTHLHYKWNMAELNPLGVAFTSLDLSFADIYFHSDYLPSTRGGVRERGTLDLLVPSRVGGLTFQRIVSREVLYQASTPMTIRWTTLFDSGTYINETGKDEHYMGFGNTYSSTILIPRNFFGVGFSGSSDGVTGSQFGIFYYRDGVKTFISQSNFNYDKLDGTGISGFTINPYKGNIWEVDMGYLGFSQVVFKVNLGGEFIKCHIFDFANNIDETIVTDPSFGLLFQVNITIPAISSPVVGANIMGNGSFGLILWSAYTPNDYHSYSRNISYSSPNEQIVILIRNPTTYNSRVNSVLCSPLLVSCATDGTKNVLFVIYQTNSANISGGVWNSISPSSPVEYSTVGSYISASSVFSFVLGKVDSKIINMNEYEILAGKDTVWVITCNSTANSDVYSSISWTEIM